MCNINVINQIPFDYEDYIIIRDVIYFEILTKKHELDVMQYEHPNSHMIETYKIIINKLEKVFSKLEEYREYFY